MNHNFTGEAWPKPDNDEAGAPKSKRRNRRGGKKRRANNVTLPERVSETGTREYRADKLREATIWVRDLDPKDKTTKPLINPRQSGEVAVEQQVADSAIPATASELTPPPARQANIASSPAESETRRREQRAEHEPVNPSPERSYFWNQADIYRPDDRDVLPTIAEAEPANKRNIVQEVNHDKRTSKPVIAHAVNPNVTSDRPAESGNFEATGTQPDPADSKTSFITRRRAKRAVQSSPGMEGDAHERAAMTQPYAEIAPAGVASYAESAAETFDTAEQLPSELARGEALPTTTVAEAEAAAASAHNAGEHAAIDRDSLAATESNPERPTVEHNLERSELLDVARSIRVDGVSIYEMFTARRIDEAGLRHIITEYLRGNDLRDVIASEIIRQQLKFERDPQLRDTPVSGTKRDSAKKAVSGIKKRTKSLINPERTRDRTERLAEFTQNALEKSHEYFNENPKASQTYGIVAIVVIYLLILIVLIAR